MKFRNKNSEPLKVTIDCGASMAKQSFKEECDINNILRKYNQKGQIPELMSKNPQYGDFSDPVDYQEALNLTIKAREQFDALPAKARDRFNNSPEKFLEFVANPENSEELVKLGLATKKVADQSVLTPDVKPEVKKTEESKKSAKE